MKRKLAKFTFVFALILIALVYSNMHLRSEVVVAYRAYAQALNDRLGRPAFELPATKEYYFNPIIARMAFETGMSPTLGFTNSISTQIFGGFSLFQVMMDIQADELAAGFFKLHFAEPFQLFISFNRRLFSKTVHVDFKPFHTLPFSLGPGVEVWNGGLKFDGRLEQNELTGEGSFTDLGLMFRGVGLHFKYGKMKYASGLQVEAEGAEMLLKEGEARKTLTFDRAILSSVNTGTILKLEGKQPVEIKVQSKPKDGWHFTATASSKEFSSDDYAELGRMIFYSYQ